MSWQEDLRRLDADLAAGRIEPAAHRKQRDELLAQASGSTVPSPVASPLRRPAAWHSTNPANRANSANPANATDPTRPAIQPVDPRTAPPQRVDTPSSGHPTRAPHPAPPWQRTDSGTQKTLSHPVVPPVPDHLTTAPSPADINPTRYLRVEGRVPGGQVSRFPEVWPTGDRPEPPRPEENPEPAGRHRDGDGSRRRPTWLFLAAGVLVVLVMIVGGTMWLGSGTDNPPQAGPPPGAPSTAAGARSDPLEERLPALPGVPNPNNSTMSVAKGRDLGLYLPKTAELFTGNGATQVIFRGSGDGAVSYLVVVVPTTSAPNAQSVVETLYQQALDAGFKPVQSPVRTVSGSDGAKFLNTTWYGSGNNVVIVGTAQPYRSQLGLSGEQDRAVKAFEDVLPAG
ncbi:hypothetical protein AMES_0119 [Amycolatopsis mediterranei S699]|uniref:Flagellar basal body-associated protein FliL n=2 Tax=Amycolatopsis mediterranei TaxID=33910 RepID=A0A0H3CX86_AMYMU|nr:hypothetical protein [Amycolatopsis mediterranei]ADJ41946.1 hypothetical protein AMED_0122 [Amycolatopsis mediterranei U32]AEK38619.1 hypothetical protein RAM_00620 [Amycolatopsis mediterranei S699]AFO73656.1 hypothetical protein AMES_0119 [Amycolatopsis mediterranei S699]AGT80785.1 hypothetical protein B737_0120 [Amycolatopsis mediterranei RB]KDO08778.1 hypothetical protein DV26_20435 [Amycolatopsis mediterranei]